jgi:hypothetical protein
MFVLEITAILVMTISICGLTGLAIVLGTTALACQAAVIVSLLSM